jgi:UDP-N-acetylglucosamine 1-carboxyvinyltransferase
VSILKVTGGRTLSGSVRVHGAKNSVLPIIAACILTSGQCVLDNCPALSDVNAAMKILRHLGCAAFLDGNTLTADAGAISRTDIPHSLMREMRSSVIFLGAILARCGEATLSLPGGCELGARPVDLHLAALRQLGAVVTEEGGNIICKAPSLVGAHVNLSFPSVGATENTMLAASLARGVTTITNAAREPEIVDLASFLAAIGVRVSGAGTSVITVAGSERITADTSHRILPDRIVAATYLAAAAAAGGDITLYDAVPEHVRTITSALSAMGCRITAEDDTLRIVSKGALRAIPPIVTEPYPGFPTDIQPQLMAASLKAAGNSVFVENIFENRFRHVGELHRLGADIQTQGRVAMVTGVTRLVGAPVRSTDLRGGAALVIAGLCAEGVTEVSNVHHIDRGYDRLEENLRRIGAEIERIDV